ncbi:putative cytochrome P450 monooxygenase [Sphaerosporella brunnea]|uniref:Putative cytochrome P450 monooxygenase n=1 Tax=Sphaerosporella brunnea TaxID=1250544 RepID=A0A5J5FAG8_9PEZI|nr:putative cytochrome P450 monooxygenase [Sphaerosporella brunnea]
MMLILFLFIVLVPAVFLSHRRRRKSPSDIPLLHPLSAFTALPILIPTLLGRRNTTIHRAHVRHGPIVRLSPTEISISSPAALSAVYTSFPKHPWYNIFRNYGAAPMFAILPGREHAARKKLLAAAYSNSAVLKSSVLRRTANETLPVLLKELANSQGRELEVWMVFVRLTMDFITASLFTRDVGSRFLDGGDQHILELYHSRRAFFALSSELPWLARWIVPKWVDDANDKLEAWCRDLCDRRRRQWRQGDEECSLDRLISAGLPEVDAASEMLDHIGAGHETTALALAFILVAMSERPELQRELRESLEPLMEVRDGWKLPKLDGEGLEEHGLLNAVIKESLRLYTPIPGSQPRVAPKDLEILGHIVPAGTAVSAQAWSLHRDPAVWKDHETFFPERWLGEEKKAEMERAWWAFGSGGRGCIGRYLATWEMRVVVASVYANFETECNGAAAVLDAYTTAPLGEKVGVVFRKV